MATYSSVLAQIKDKVSSRNKQDKVEQITVGLVNIQGRLTKVLDYETMEIIDWPENQRCNVYLADKFEIILTTKKRFIILIGGRGSGKSIGTGRIAILDMMQWQYSYYCLREFQKSVKDSVHSLMKSQAQKIFPDQFTIFDQDIRYEDAQAIYGGIARNPESIKSAYGFKRYWVEEAQSCSAESLRQLTPTARQEDTNDLPNQNFTQKDVDTSIIFTANPSSSEDPFSKRFINPFIDKINKEGIYEDDLHLLVIMNYNDNPWFAESGLEQERAWDEKHLDSALYNHIWDGAFNDSIEYALIVSSWFDACVDAHLKLNWHKRDCLGQRRMTHDPSDLGGDPKAICLREGNIIRNIDDRGDLDVNEGSDWALGEAVRNSVDIYEWDTGGMGVTLKRDVNEALEGKRIDAYQFNGQAKLDHPDAIYEPSGATNIKKQLHWFDVCKNLRAQCYLKLRDRVYRTYRAVVFNENYPTCDLISISSDCNKLRQLKSELCRIPVKPSSQGKFELYTKAEMRTKFKVKSPNLSDCVMMSEREHLNEEAENTDNIIVLSRLNYWK